MNLIYQVYLGEEKKLYNHCTKSVKEYAKKIGAHYKILTAPKLRITPNIFRTDRRDKTGGWKKLGYMGGLIPPTQIIFEPTTFFKTMMTP